MKKNSDIIFIHTNNAYDLGNGRYNIILSPAFYWIKKENVGVGSIFSAKKIASAVFEGEIPENEYKYFAKKTSQKGEYYFFAYNEKEILNKLKTLGVEIRNIKAIYFAQNEFEDIANPISINKKTAIIQKDGIISLAPANFIKEILQKSQKLQYIINRELVFDASAKVAHMIHSDLEIFNSFKKTQIAFMLHIQPETLSRVLKKFVNSQFVELKDKNYIIKDGVGLNSIFVNVGL